MLKYLMGAAAAVALSVAPGVVSTAMAQAKTKVGFIYVGPVGDFGWSYQHDQGRIAIEKAREAGKPEAMLEKIAEGTVQKYLKEVTLLGQVFVKAEDGKQTIEQLLKSKGASVASFVLYIVGEGIEKKVNDFAAEVAAQAAQAAAAAAK